MLIDWFADATVLDRQGKLHLSTIYDAFVGVSGFDGSIRTFSKVIETVSSDLGIEKRHTISISGVKKPGYLGRKLK